MVAPPPTDADEPRRRDRAVRAGRRHAARRVRRHPATLAALCAFLFVAALVVFVAVPGPGTLETLSRSVPLAGAVLVVAVLLLLSTDAALRWLWILTALVAAAWTASAVWRTRRTED